MSPHTLSRRFQVALPLITFFSAALLYGAGCIGIQPSVQACPFAVFGGFFAGTGVQLLQYGLTLMHPDFVSFVAAGDTGVAGLFDSDSFQLWFPGVRLGLGSIVALPSFPSALYQIFQIPGASFSETTSRPNPTMRLEFSGPPSSKDQRFPSKF
jgi:hypothetical protein